MEKQAVRKVALLGLGTVGTGVRRVMEKQKSEFPNLIGVDLEIAKILVRDKSKNRPGVSPELLTDNWKEILEDDSIEIVIEVMGGIEPARTYILEALRRGKHVVTANKDLMAEYGHDLLEMAHEKGCDLLFEAAVAGGIPIIRPLKQCLAGNDITDIMGIVNGTTNFILTKMAAEGMEFQQALDVATKLGYAEADPTADIEGLDAGRKIAILASIAFHSRVKFSHVSTEGISKITAKDIQYAKDLGMVIKLMAIAKNTEQGIEVRVHPLLIPDNHPLASVNDAFNGIFVHGDAVGDTMFYGLGAGELPTASAIVGDVIDVARNIAFGCTGRIGCTCYKSLPIKEAGAIESKYFLRMQLEDRPGALAGIAGVFGNNGVSIAQMVQKNRKNDIAEIVVITHLVEERRLRDAIAILSGMTLVKEISSVIRVYGEKEF